MNDKVSKNVVGGMTEEPTNMVIPGQADVIGTTRNYLDANLTRLKLDRLCPSLFSCQEVYKLITCSLTREGKKSSKQIFRKKNVQTLPCA